MSLWKTMIAAGVSAGVLVFGAPVVAEAVTGEPYFSQERVNGCQPNGESILVGFEEPTYSPAEGFTVSHVRLSNLSEECLGRSVTVVLATADGDYLASASATILEDVVAGELDATARVESVAAVQVVIW